MLVVLVGVACAVPVLYYIAFVAFDESRNAFSALQTLTAAQLGDDFEYVTADGYIGGGSDLGADM
jgi:hypothetical protein